MEEVTTWTHIFYNSLRAFGETLMSALPGILGAIFILLFGWLFAKLVSVAIKSVLKLIKFDKMANKIDSNEFLEKANIKLTPIEFVGKFIYWILMLLVFITAADTLGWRAVSQEISKLLGYLPKLLAAIVFFIIGMYIATFIRDLIKGATSSLGISAGKLISSVVYYLLFILITLTALEQGGIDTSIITSNLLMIIGTILAAGAISYGFASRDVLANILAGFFSRHTFKVGQIIEIEDLKGKIIETTNMAVMIETNEKEKVVIPAHQLITNRVKIIS